MNIKISKNIIWIYGILNIYDKENYSLTMEFINSLEDMAKKYETIIISFKYCSEIKAAAQVLLFAKLEYILNNYKTEIIIRKSEKKGFANNILEESGLLELCRKRVFENKFNNPHLLMVSSSDKKLIDKITDFVIKQAYGDNPTPEQEKLIGAAISEAHYNVILHAYGESTTPKKWWLRCSVLKGELYLIIYDNGIGFSNSFDEKNAKFAEINWVEVLQEFLNRLGIKEDVSHFSNKEAFSYFSDNRQSQIIYSAMSDNETGVQGDLSNKHGRGSKSIKALVGEHKNGKLWVFSNFGQYCYTHQNDKPLLLDHDLSINGTLLQWNIKL